VGADRNSEGPPARRRPVDLSRTARGATTAADARRKPETCQGCIKTCRRGTLAATLSDD